MNPGQEKVGPENFQLLKVLGKGGYGKVIICVFEFNLFFANSVSLLATCALICDMIKGTESLVENLNSHFLTPLSHNFNMLHFDANPITIGYLVAEL